MLFKEEITMLEHAPYSDDSAPVPKLHLHFEQPRFESHENSQGTVTALLNLLLENYFYKCFQV
jgi:hypothetical protein